MDGAGEIVFCNLRDPEVIDCQDVEYYRPILARLGITPRTVQLGFADSG